MDPSRRRQGRLPGSAQGIVWSQDPVQFTWRIKSREHSLSLLYAGIRWMWTHYVQELDTMAQMEHTLVCGE